MLFGNRSEFAIEIGEVVTYASAPGYFIQLQLHIGNKAIGDWNDRIPIDPSIRIAKTLLVTSPERRMARFPTSDPRDVLAEVFDAFYKEISLESPDLRDIFHVEDLGLQAVCDRFGIVVVGATAESDRCIVKDLETNAIDTDIQLPVGFFESVLTNYICWSETIRSQA